MAYSLPTYGRNEATITARKAEVPLANFDNGCNRAASCAPGIGIGTGDSAIDPTTDEWTTATQYGVARTPQLSMHIGGDGTSAGSSDHLGDHAVQVIDYEAGPDYNDTANFVVADQQATNGQVFHIATGTVNRSDKTIEIGDRAWGTVPVA